LLISPVEWSYLNLQEDATFRFFKLLHFLIKSTRNWLRALIQSTSCIELIFSYYNSILFCYWACGCLECSVLSVSHSAAHVYRTRPLTWRWHVRELRMTWTNMCTSAQPSVKSNRAMTFPNLTWSRALASNGLQSSVVYLFLWQTALRN